MTAPQSHHKVLHVVISMAVGGAERLVHDMVKFPAFQENRPVVCCLDVLGELGERLKAEEYRVYHRGRRPGIDLELIRWLSDVIRRERITVVHAHQYSPLFYAVPAALLAGRVKVVYTEHGRFYPEVRSWKRSLFNPLLALGVDHLVSISAATAQAMASFDNLPLRRIRVIHNGIDCSGMMPPLDLAAKREALGLPPGCRIIGTAARFNSIKNLQMLLRVTKLVLRRVPEVCLVLAGQGEEEARLRAEAQALGIADRVRFIGLRFDLPEVYQLFEVFLLSSLSEGISVTLLEAMASGVPAVVTGVGGNLEVVVEGSTGFLVPVDADELMAQRVCHLLQDGKARENLGQAALLRAEHHFSLASMMKAYCSLYDR